MKISLEEIKLILDSFQNNKSPGSDGIPIEFYKTCWNLISDSLLECTMESFKYGEMSCSQRKAVITLPYLPVYNAHPCIMRTPILDSALKEKEKKKRKQKTEEVVTKE